MGIFSNLFGGKKKPAPAPRGRAPVSPRQEADRQRRRKQEDEDENRAFEILETGRDPKREAFDRESQRRFDEQQAHLEAEGTWTAWYPLVSSNVDSTRYLMSERLCQIIYKSGDCYEYSEVEPDIFQGFLQASSHGKFRWYVFGDPRLGGSYYPYKKVSGGHSVSPPVPERAKGKPYAVPAHIEAILQKKNRIGPVPTARGVGPPPPSYRGK